MYLTSKAILAAIKILRDNVHPFIGITFLACKRYNLSIGSTEIISIDSLTRDHMDHHHRIDRSSRYYFQPFKAGAPWWVSAKKYPSGGLQTVNTQTFPDAFIHARGSKEWAFDTNYIDIISRILNERRFTTYSDALAVWIYKDDPLEGISTYGELIDLFYRDFNINDYERETLFQPGHMRATIPENVAFSHEPLEMTAVLAELPEAPDARSEAGRTIASLQLSDAGPARDMRFDFGSRLSIITGDNGLGKSFLLDFAWWAATGTWADRENMPHQSGINRIPTVTYSLTGSSGRLSTFSATFDQRLGGWNRPKGAMTIEALAVFSRADGSFAISDPVRGKFNKDSGFAGSMTAKAVWDGRTGVLEGLVRDWVTWQTTDKKTFDQFSLILKRLSPEDLGTLTPGAPVRIASDPRMMPTIRHRYGAIPVIHASSGVQRVLLLAYLIIWSWKEHELAAERLGQEPLRRMMVIVDELEAHLHPKWQRIVLPALMSISDVLSSDLSIQMVAATHSPMILASMESKFDTTTDVLYHLYGAGAVVKLEETPFVKYGDASGWLTSPLFGLSHARSKEAEAAIEAAKKLQLDDEAPTEAVAEVSERLKQHLAGDDKFWPRWLYFAEQRGVML